MNNESQKSFWCFFFSGSPGSNSMDAVVAIVGVSWCLSALWGFVGVGG